MLFWFSFTRDGIVGQGLDHRVTDACTMQQHGIDGAWEVCIAVAYIGFLLTNQHRSLHRYSKIGLAIGCKVQSSLAKFLCETG